MTGDMAREGFEGSVSSRCWWFTPYDDGWDGCGERLAADAELVEIIAMERALPAGEAEALRAVVEGPVNRACPCGHYLFPEPYLELLDAIGRGEPPQFLTTCWAVESGRKSRLADYCMCLDGWLQGAPAGQVGASLGVSSHSRVDWPRVATGLWEVLGEPTEIKRLLVEWLLHEARVGLCNTYWPGEGPPRWCSGLYLGEVRERPPLDGAPTMSATWVVEGTDPALDRVVGRLKEILPDWQRFAQAIDEWWLCAPKAFRFMERYLWCAGAEAWTVTVPWRPVAGPEVPGFLMCGDTHALAEGAPRIWKDLLGSLRAWWRGGASSTSMSCEVSKRLGRWTESKAWLVRLLHHKLALLAETNPPLGRLVGMCGFGGGLPEGVQHSHGGTPRPPGS
ncbi:MAG: hypothetical protein GF320_19725 [Armatimonadia bacterium]|nr:hypothetical protein [Armatimonadia bacterium]